MQPLRRYSVVPKLPEKLMPLWDLAYNIWYAWTHDIADLFRGIDQPLWQECEDNPVRFLNLLPQPVLEELARDEFFLQRMEELRSSLETYVARKGSLVDFPGNGHGPAVAYLSLEYGLTPGLPIYSGGLGILAGDHLKSASDLNLPLAAVGLAYKEGYFRQYLTPDGWQQESYPDFDFNQLPMRPARGPVGGPGGGPGGGEIRFSLSLRGEPLAVRVWEVKVGRIPLYLLDCNLPENPEHLRSITDRLYGGDLEMRLRQEFLLGVGGIRALAALGLSPRVIHMNEGHSAFAGLERIRVLMKDHGLSYEAAQEVVASSSVFTTHTPVPAGNDRFPPELLQPYFEDYARELGLSWPVFLALGREDPRDDHEGFCMTVLALRLSRFCNGVSTLHGRVSRRMWKRVWPQYPVEDVPIRSLTNGVHMPTWVAPDLAQLFDRYLGANWREDPDCRRVWDYAGTIPDAELWRTHERLRERLVEYVRISLRRQFLEKGARAKDMEIASEVLDPRALTIGLARRFATYKRANMLLMDKERLLRLIGDRERPVQFIVAGKAHPADNEGKKIIQELVTFCRREDARHSIVFLEDYDMRMALAMVQGCDIWLNNPRRPLEACGTSGMKAMANGVLHFSTIDGWWAEAYTPDNAVGFAVGRGEEYEDTDYQDFVECQTLFNVLETDIIPEFYDRGHGDLPRTWIAKMKNALTRLGPEYNSHRMVQDYVTRAYNPAFACHKRLESDGFAPAKSLAEWRLRVMTLWDRLSMSEVRAETVEQVFVEEPIPVSVKVCLGQLRPEDVRVELYHGELGPDGGFAERTTSPMVPDEPLGDGCMLYRGEMIPMAPGPFGFTVRVMPSHDLLLDPHPLGLIRWAPSE
jgi:starch phosphorylase